MRSSLFWDSMQCRLVDCYRCFGTTYWSHLPRASSLWPLKMWLILCSEILVHKVPEEGKSQLSSGLRYELCWQTYTWSSHYTFTYFLHSAVGSLKWISMWPSGCNESCFLKMGQYSFCCLTYDRTIASTKVNSPYSAIVLLSLAISSILSFP